jgi:hypothetical protein
LSACVLQHKLSVAILSTKKCGHQIGKRAQDCKTGYCGDPCQMKAPSRHGKRRKRQIPRRADATCSTQASASSSLSLIFTLQATLEHKIVSRLSTRQSLRCLFILRIETEVVGISPHALFLSLNTPQVLYAVSTHSVHPCTIIYCTECIWLKEYRISLGVLLCFSRSSLPGFSTNPHSRCRNGYTTTPIPPTSLSMCRN